MPRAARSPIFILWRDASLVLLSWLLVTPALWADDYQLGQAAYELGDYEQTVQLWRPLAEAGDVRAQFGLGTLYFEGHGVTSDLEQSARWFRKVAEQGFAPAQFNLGNAYKHGRGVARDDRLASAWWRHAAEQEFAPAQFNLGTQYYFGRGVEKNEQEALRWYRRAADNGHPRALELFPAQETGADEVAASKDADWLKAQFSDEFTIQLLATPNEASARELASVPALAASRPTTVFEFLRDGEPWFAVIHGVFPSRAAAEKAVQSLPPELVETPPWIRRVGDVQSIVVSAE